MGESVFDMNKEILNEAVNIVKGSMGANAELRLKALLNDPTQVENFFSSLSEKDISTVNAVIKNPQLLKKILSSPKTNQALNELLGGRPNGK